MTKTDFEGLRGNVRAYLQAHPDAKRPVDVANDLGPQEGRVLLDLIADGHVILSGQRTLIYRPDKSNAETVL